METLIETFSTNPILYVTVGLIIRYIIGRRQFNRRGIGGLQHYRNFEVGFFTTIIEWLLKWTANGLILFGLLTMIINY